MDGFEDNLARALTDYLELPEDERRQCEEDVRNNCVADLSWGTLAQQLVALVR
jgi:glycosyltransferase involved in cell wall biosynthesis